MTSSNCKSGPKELLKVLFSSGTRGSKFNSVYNFPAQWRSLFGNERILNFEITAVRDIRL